MESLRVKDNFFGICILFFLQIMLLSCTKSVDGSLKYELAGEWKLDYFACCDLPQEEFENHDIVWRFDGQKNVVTFIHNMEFDNNSEYGFQVAGTYEFVTSDNVLTIFYQNTTVKLEFNFNSDNSMMLSRNVESDGIVMRFNK